MTPEQRAEQFIQETLTAASSATVNRGLIALAMFEAAATWMRQDVEEYPHRLSVYGDAIQMLTAHVLSPVAELSGPTH